MAELVTPGIVGRLLRLALAGAVGFLLYDYIVLRINFWDGFENLDSIGLVIPVILVWSWVVTELLGKSWGQWPTVAMLVIAVAIGLTAGWSSAALGIFIWVWCVVWALLLGPAHLLAATLATPGCEMRSYAHLWAKLRGKDVEAVLCPGYIDRWDGFRIGGH